MNKAKSIVILGGGTAGWLTALFIKNRWKDAIVSVIEDPSKPPIIAGESGGYALTLMFDRIGIDTQDWAKNVNATPKLGGIFHGWNGKDSVFYHSLVTSYTSYWSKLFPSIEEQYFYLRALIGLNINIVDISVTGDFVKNNKVPYDAELNIVNNTSHMWHFDSRANANYLKKLGIIRGIKLIEDQYQTLIRNNNGSVRILKLKNQSVAADWFFDCSGFARLLLKKELGVDIDDQSSYFPANAVLPWWSDTELNTGTVATTMDAGWTWKIGLTHRTGQGYLYDPDILTKDQALDEIHRKFGSHIEPVASLTFTPCILKESWKHNVIGIGLSTGFMEPLEANGTGAIVDALLALELNWSPECTSSNQLEFNNTIYASYTNIKDFLSLHYRGRGLNTKFWREQKDPLRVPDTLKERLDGWTEFYKTGKINLSKYQQQYSIESWATVIQGLNLIDPALINVGEIGPYIHNYYTKEKIMQNRIQERCIGIQEWNNLTKLKK